MAYIYSPGQPYKYTINNWCHQQHNPAMSRAGQNHIYTVYIRYFWQGDHRIYGHIWRIYTVLANPINTLSTIGFSSSTTLLCLRLARTIYIRCTYGIFGREIIKYTVYIYVYKRFWPTLVTFISTTLLIRTFPPSHILLCAGQAAAQTIKGYF